MIPKAPLSAFSGERLPGIGHNKGPSLDDGTAFRRFAWKKARAELMPRLPLEVVRRRVRRAAELGLEYPAYASILLGTGRDVLGFLFTCNALGETLARTGTLPASVAHRITGIVGADKMLAAESGLDPRQVAARLRATDGLLFASTTALPAGSAHWHAGRDAIRAALDPLKLPGDTVIMIGTEPHERSWADAARLAQFLPAERYFGGL